MILLQGFLKTTPDNVANVKAAAAPFIAASRAEPGCLHYAFAQDVDEPGTLHIIERWRDAAALEAHNDTPHVKAFTAALPTLGLTGVWLARYEASSEQILFGG
jgi:quinol monooxygenase YgiN